MMRAADSRLIGAHQGIVDAVQRSPAWLGQQCAIALCVVTVVRVTLFETVGWSATLQLVCCFEFWLMARSPSWYGVGVGSAWYVRAWFLAWLVVCVLGIALLLAWGAEVPPVAWTALLVDLLLTSFAYFACCKPPRPRVPKGRFVPEGGA